MCRLRLDDRGFASYSTFIAVVSTSESFQRDEYESGSCWCARLQWWRMLYFQTAAEFFGHSGQRSGTLVHGDREDGLDVRVIESEYLAGHRDRSRSKRSPLFAPLPFLTYMTHESLGLRQKPQGVENRSTRGSKRMCAPIWFSSVPRSRVDRTSDGQKRHIWRDSRPSPSAEAPSVSHKKQSPPST